MLIATDLDGTLVAAGSKQPGPRTAEVLERVDAAGVPVVFVTARPLRWMVGFWPHVGEHGMAIVSNGAIVYDAHAHEIRRLTGIHAEVGLEVVRAVADAVPGAGFAIECADGIRLDENFVERYGMPDGTRRGPLADLWDVPAVKLLVRNEEMDPDDFRDRVFAAVGDSANATWTVPGLVEISAAGVTKASALVELCEELGVGAEEVVAFGDMPNDLPMLTWAGTSYAVAGAHESVLAAADHVAPPCEEEGVAQVIERLVLDPHPSPPA